VKSLPTGAIRAHAFCGEALCNFGTFLQAPYALVVLHDENMNGKLDIGWTTEGTSI